MISGMRAPRFFPNDSDTVQVHEYGAKQSNREINGYPRGANKKEARSFSQPTA